MLFIILIAQVNLENEREEIEKMKGALFPYDSINQNFLKFFHQLSKTYKPSPLWSLETQEKSFLRPQSFSILMNFGQDGQQSVILMDQESIFW